MKPKRAGTGERSRRLPGCAAQGESLDELMRSAREALNVFLEAMAEEGEEPPGDRFVGDFELTRV